MKHLALSIFIIVFVFSCSTSEKIAATNVDSKNTEKTYDIEDDDSDFAINIVEPGFNVWLKSIAKPKGYYSLDFMKNRNKLFVTAWNQRVLNPYKYDNNLYQRQIMYNSSTDYGYNVNYKLYHFFIYFQLQYDQKLTGFTTRI